MNEMRKAIALLFAGVLFTGALLECGASSRFRNRFLQKDAEDVESELEHNTEEADQEVEEMEHNEDEASIEAKNLDAEIKYSESLQSEDQREENAAAAEKEAPKQPGCAVSKAGKLNVAKDPTDILTTVPQVVTIGKDKLIATFDGRPDSPSISIPLVEIKTPIETLVRTQKCFRLFHKKKAYAFCAESTAKRDDWVSDLYKAVFCINSGATPSSKIEKKTATGEEVKLPSRSTKMQRYMKQLNEQNVAAAKAAENEESPNRHRKKEVEEIQIVGEANSAPKLTVNGDSVEMPHAVHGEATMNEGKMEF